MSSPTALSPRPLFAVACAAATLVAAPAFASPGSIIITGDEWLVSNQAFTANVTQTRRLTDNIEDCFDNGGPASFAVLTSHPIAYNTQFRNRLTSLGNTVVNNPGGGGPFTLATLQQYDAVFLAGSAWAGPANAPALTAYVQGGGHVMVMGGTSTNGSAAAAWAPFLNTFGLGFGGAYFAVPPGGTPLQIAATPLPNAATAGISSVSWSFGSTALDLNAADPLNQVALWGNFSAVTSPTMPGNTQSLPIIATWNIPSPGSLAGVAMGLVMAAHRRRK